MTASFPASRPADLLRATAGAPDGDLAGKGRARGSPAPLCPITPGGIPVRLLVDAAPRSRARRALPLVVLLALAAGLAAVALAGCGAPRLASAPRIGPSAARAPAGPAFARHAAAPLGRE